MASKIVAASKYTRVPQILVKGPKQPTFEEWFAKEIKEGGFLDEYLRREKALSEKRMRAVAMRTHGFKQNNKSDMRRIADVPAREYQRWLNVDPHFWDDNSNLKSWRRSNPDARVYI